MNKIMLKRTMAILLGVALLFVLSACGQQKVTSEYWVEEEYEEVNSDESSDNNDSSNGANDSSKDDQSSSSSNKKPTKNENTSNKNNKWNVKMVDVGTKGANGKDYSNYDPYKGIEKYKGKTIKFATWIDHSKDEMASVIEDFEKKYNIKIDTVYCSQDNYIKDVLALIAANNAPDIVVENATFPASLQIVQDFSVSGVDLNEPFWDQKAIKAMSYGGKNYYVNAVNSVVNGASGITVYNKDLLTANGIKTPEQYYAEGQWTFSNLIKICNQVKALGSDYSGMYIDEYYLYPQFGSSCVSYDGSKFTNLITSNNMVEGLKQSLNLAQLGLTSNGQEKFINGKAAVYISDCYALKSTGYLRKMDPDSLGFTYLPKKDGASTEVACSILRGYGISKGSKNPEAAGYVLRYLLDGKNYDFSDNCFINKEAANFYFELQNKYVNSNRHFIYDDGVAEYVGTWWYEWTKGAETPDQASVALNSHSNQVQNAVDKVNAYLKTLK